MSAFSVNEIESLASKAARGSGADPAQATHFGRACAYHLAANRTPNDILAALHVLPEGPIQLWPITQPSPITELDLSYADAMAAPDKRPKLPARLTCPPDLIQSLHRLAHKTYVPATASSRTAGAGAGLTDND